MVVGNRNSDETSMHWRKYELIIYIQNKQLVSTQAKSNEKKSYVACINLLLAMNRYQRFFDVSKLAMQQKTLAHVDYKAMHRSILSFSSSPSSPSTTYCSMCKEPLRDALYYNNPIEKTLNKFSSRGQGKSPLKYANCENCISLERKVYPLEESLDFY